MDLKSFVSETLTQIVEGVADAQKRIAEADVGAAINPTLKSESAKQKIAEASPVKFDVAVTVTDESASRSGAGASVGFLSVISAKVDANIEESGSLKNEAISRIEFEVQLSQPGDITTYVPRSATRQVRGGY